MSNKSPHRLNTTKEKDTNKDLSGILDFIRDEVPDKEPPRQSPLKRKDSPLKKIDEEQKVHHEPVFTKSSIEHSQKSHQRPASTKLAYGATKRRTVGKDGEDVIFQVKDLEKENLALKEKENLLSREITKMQTKLRRIEELVRQGKNYSDGDFSTLQNDLEDQFNSIRDENDTLKERVRKLKTIQKGLSATDFKKQSKISKTLRPASRSKAVGHQSKCEYHYSVKYTHNINNNIQPPKYGGTGGYGKLSDDMRTQLVKIEREIMKLTQERDRLGSVSTGNLQQDELLRRIKERDSEIRDISRSFEDIEQGFINKEKIFKESKHYMEELLKQIREQRINNETLKQKNLSLQIRAQQSNNLNDQLRGLEVERDQIEKSIRTITSEPFFKREKGESTLKRIHGLEEKLLDKEKHFRALKEEEIKKQNDLQVLKSTVEKLKGERDYLNKENDKLRGKFTAENPLNDLNIHKSLFKMDPKKYGETVGDLMVGQDNVPIWAGMDFLERGQEQIDPNNIKQLKTEILKIRHENKDFAAELEKAQNLLHLQRDIEKDNTQYYEAEKKRLDLLMKSSTMKAEELARRADEKSRQIHEVSRKLGVHPSRSPSPDKSQAIGGPSHLDLIDTQSEFSVMTNESDIRTDENVLDFVVQDAEYYYDAFKQVMDAREMTLHQKTLITFATIDFYNHNTETSQIAEGYKPIYNTQFSFKNKIDDFYVQYLQKQQIKLDFYISKNNAAIHIGHAKVFLREIVERETAVQELSYKTPVIQKTLRIYPINGNQDQPIGSIRFKMRMRKPISEALRYYRNRNEVTNMHATGTLQDAETKSRKKLITIQIVGGKDIKVKYSAISKIAPFFYYQFYTFDERYSATSTGENPIFEDTQSYEVIFDAKLINYLQKEPLELILFDDNAPVTGVEKGGKAISQDEQIDDMIGTAKIPLEDLIKGASIHDRFPIRNLKRENCGQLEIKVTIMDLDFGISSITQPKAAQMLSYNKQWENDIIYRIAQKLAKFPSDVELLFGVFSRGQKTVSKEDFKYCCLQRLSLKKEISDREMDMFLTGCPQLVDREYIDKNDFVMIFSSAITQARHELQNEEALQYSTIKRHEDIQKSMTNRQLDFDEFSRSATPAMQDLQSSMSNLNFNELEVMEILGKVKDYGKVEGLLEKIRLYSINDSIASRDFISTLANHGSITEMECSKVATYLEVKQRVKVSKFIELFDRAIQQSSIKSQALKKFIECIKTKGEALVIKFLTLDYNRDGQLNVDGLVAALLSQEFGFRVDEAKEIFNIVKRGDLFYYKEYVLTINPTLKIVMLSRSQTPTQGPNQLNRTDTKQSVFDSRSLSQSSTLVEDPRLKTIKTKLSNYIKTNDITLGSLFQLIDTDSNSVLSLSEFIQKMKMLQVNLDDEELRVLFRALDKTGTGNINYKQFVTEFPEINTTYLINKIKKIIIGSKVAPEMIFEKYSDKKNQRMSKTEFKTFVKQFHSDKVADHEIDSLFRHFDQQGYGYITKEFFISAFGRDVKEQVFKISIEDIVKPLATKILAFNVNMASLFDKYDTNKNGRLSAEELSRALKQDQNIQLNDDEVLVIKEYFKNKHNTLEIKKMDFIDLINTKFERHFDSEEAKQSLTTLKQKLISADLSTVQVFSDYDNEKVGKVTLRNFKVAVNNLHALNQYSIDNLARYLDKDNTGFISINEIDIALRQQAVPLSSTGSFSQSLTKKRTEKWK